MVRRSEEPEEHVATVPVGAGPMTPRPQAAKRGWGATPWIVSAMVRRPPSRAFVVR